MAKKPGVEFFINNEFIGRRAKNILQCARGDSFFAFRYKQRSFFSTSELQIFMLIFQNGL